MIITSGWAKGMRLAVPKGLSTRPTSARVRAAALNMLVPHLDNANNSGFLDIFAGSGAMGLEALSRLGSEGSAPKAVFIESDRTALSCLQRNIAEFRRRAQSQGLPAPDLTILGMDVRLALAKIQRAQDRFAVIFADPPYAKAMELIRDIAPALLTLLAAEGVMMLETASNSALDQEAATGWQMVAERTYGDTKLTTLVATAGPPRS